MAKPYREGSHWSFRLRIKGEDIYRTGYATQALANEAQTEIRFALRQKGQPAAAGPFRTTLGQAFMNYARERLPKLKGANVDAVRINRYLRAVGLPIIRLKRLERPMNGASIYWEVRFEAETTSRTPNSLKAHQAKLSKNSSQSLLVRQRLAGMTMSDVMTYHIQEFIDAMVTEGKGAATIDHERAELRRLFSHAIHIWRWRSIETNPASNLNMPAVNNKRDRVLSNDEWRKMLKALAESKNRYAIPLICLILETSMRSCEPLTEARWGNVNWTRRILELPDSKGGKRPVLLGCGYRLQSAVSSTDRCNTLS